MDEAHRNFHTASGRHKPFADLLRNDGYLVTSNSQPFTADKLQGINVLVIANATGPDGHEGRPAFTPEEEAALVQWVKSGRSLGIKFGMNRRDNDDRQLCSTSCISSAGGCEPLAFRSDHNRL
jgi:hypothetical protein